VDATDDYDVRISLFEFYAQKSIFDLLATANDDKKALSSSAAKAPGSVAQKTMAKVCRIGMWCGLAHLWKFSCFCHSLVAVDLPLAMQQEQHGKAIPPVILGSKSIAFPGLSEFTADSADEAIDLINQVHFSLKVSCAPVFPLFRLSCLPIVVSPLFFSSSRICHVLFFSRRDCLPCLCQLPHGRPRHLNPRAAGHGAQAHGQNWPKQRVFSFSHGVFHQVVAQGKSVESARVDVANTLVAL
jgi:hypothetical protein